MGWRWNSGLRNEYPFGCTGRRGENGILSFITWERASSDLMLESSGSILSWMSNYIFEAAIRIVRQSMREDDPRSPLGAGDRVPVLGQRREDIGEIASLGITGAP